MRSGRWTSRNLEGGKTRKGDARHVQFVNFFMVGGGILALEAYCEHANTDQCIFRVTKPSGF